MEPADTVDGWVRPVGTSPAEPRWGHPDGLQVGLAAEDLGPRGLLRLYAAYLDHPRERLVNFVAVEPIPAGETARGLSELEHSTLDDVRGKRFWSCDDPADPTPREATPPARGVVETIDGIERLTVFVLVEPFDNGADVYVRMRFRADRPHEVALAAFRRESSVALESCVLTATMGNFARLRELHLADRVVTSGSLWPEFEGAHFADHVAYGVDSLARVDGAVVVSATPDESAPHEAVYADDVAEHWKYVGRRAVQTWRAEDPDPRLTVSVNGRAAYWASESTIPGGISYENFELIEPFRNGREFTVAVAPLDEPSASPTSVHTALLDDDAGAAGAQ